MVIDAKQAVGLVLVSVVAAFVGNALRSDSLPMRGPLGPPPQPEAGSELLAATASAAIDAWLEGAFFLDLRSHDAWETQRVAGSLSLDAEDFGTRYFDVGHLLDPEMPLVLYGAGPDSFAVRRTVVELQEMGHVDVRFVVCGLDGLLSEGIDPAEGPEEGLP